MRAGLNCRGTMSRVAILVLSVLALSVLVSAQHRWPAGHPSDDDDGDLRKMQAKLAQYRAKKSDSRYDDSSDAYDHTRGRDDSYEYRDSTKNSKSSDDSYRDESKDSSADEDSDDTKKSDGYYTGRGKWRDGKDDHNMPYEYTREHTGPCIASRWVQVTPQGNRPANPQCRPSPNAPMAPCEVPTFCPSSSNDPLCPPDEYKRYDANGVWQHFRNQPAYDMVDARHHTYSCVDSRGEEPMLGTTGGDLGEIMSAAMALMKVMGVTYKDEYLDAIFDAFTQNIASPDRPLYFHTDDGSLRRLFTSLRGKLEHNPVVLPWRGPGPEKGDDANIWLDGLTDYRYNGCGHIRLQMDPAFAKLFSISIKVKEVADCSNATGTECIDSAAVGKRAISNFFNYWWWTPSGSLQRRKTAFHIEGVLTGPQLGKAVAFVRNTPSDVCTEYAPVVRPTFGGSKVFVYSPDAVAEWRQHAAINGFADVLTKYGVDTRAFVRTWNNIAKLHIAATLTWVNPANQIGQFDVDVPVRDTESDEGDDEGFKHGQGHYETDPTY